MARAVEQITAAVRRVDPRTDIDERAGGQVEPAELLDLLSPSLFGGRRIARDLPLLRICGPPRSTALGPFLDGRADDTTVVLAARGRRQGQGGTGCRSPGRSAADHVCPTDPRRGAARVRPRRGTSGRRHRSRRTRPRCCSTPSAATCANSRRCRSASRRLGWPGYRRHGRTAYYRGRAEVSGFAVSDRAVVGDTWRRARDAALGAVDRHASRRHRRCDGRWRSISSADVSSRSGQPVPAGAATRHAAVEGETGPVAGARVDR